MSSISKSFGNVNPDLQVIKRSQSDGNIQNEISIKKENPDLQVIKRSQSDSEIPVKKDSSSINVNRNSSSSTLKSFFSRAFSSFSGVFSSKKVDEFSSLKKDLLDDINKDRKTGGTLKFALGEKNFLGIISNKKEVSEFKKFAESENTIENIDFMKDVKDLMKMKNPAEFKNGFKNLCDKFIKNDSEHEIDLSTSVKKEMLKALESGDVRKMLKSLKNTVGEVNDNLSDTKSRFESNKNEEKKSHESILVNPLPNNPQAIHQPSSIQENNDVQQVSNQKVEPKGFRPGSKQHHRSHLTHNILEAGSIGYHLYTGIKTAKSANVGKVCEAIAHHANHLKPAMKVVSSTLSAVSLGMGAILDGFSAIENIKKAKEATTTGEKVKHIVKATAYSLSSVGSTGVLVAAGALAVAGFAAPPVLAVGGLVAGIVSLTSYLIDKFWK